MLRRGAVAEWQRTVSRNYRFAGSNPARAFGIVAHARYRLSHAEWRTELLKAPLRRGLFYVPAPSIRSSSRSTSTLLSGDQASRLELDIDERPGTGGQARAESSKHRGRSCSSSGFAGNERDGCDGVRYRA
jgi:hypothetical protein